MGKRRRRVSGEGTVYQRPDKRWNAALWVLTPDGKKRISTTKRTKLDADRWLTQRKAERDGGIISQTEDPTVEEFLNEWLATSVVPIVEPKTREGYEVAVRRHLIPVLGRSRLRRLGARDVAVLMAQKQREGLSVRTRRGILQTLGRALEQGVRWGVLTRNVACDVDPPKERSEEHKEIAVFTEAQLHQLFQAAEKLGDRFHNLYVVAARTGLRQGELLGLRWEDLSLDLDPAILTLRRSLAQRKGSGDERWVFTPLKRKNQRRRLALFHEAKDALVDQRELQAVEKRSARWRDRGLVFPNTRGDPMDGRRLYNRHYKPLLRKAGLPDLTFHDLRHTFATIALFDWGLGVKEVQSLLGHASVKLTLDRYSHLAPDKLDDTIARLNEATKKGQ